MAKIYGDIKKEIVDLGFEVDEEVADEYSRVMLHAINRSLSVIHSTVILPNISYFELNYDFDIETPIRLFKEDSEDDARTNLPTILEPLLPLLSAHWLWLDDDLTKATIYWNEYDDLKNQLLNTIARPYKAQIEGGF